MSYIPSMEWEVEFTDEFSNWWDGLSEAEQVDVNAKVILLQKIDPSLPRPHADLIHSSRHPNMKELRVQHSGRPYRVLFAFDPRRCAILLIVGMMCLFRWRMHFTTSILKRSKARKNSNGKELQRTSSKNASRSARSQRRSRQENDLRNGPC